MHKLGLVICRRTAPLLDWGRFVWTGQDVGSEVFGIFLDGEELNGQFDTIIVDMSINPGDLFLEPLNSSAIEFFIPPGPGFCCLTFISFRLS